MFWFQYCKIRQALQRCNAEAVAYISDTVKSVRKRFEETQVVMVANAMLIFDVRHFLAVYNIEVRWGEYACDEESIKAN